MVYLPTRKSPVMSVSSPVLGESLFQPLNTFLPWCPLHLPSAQHIMYMSMCDMKQVHIWCKQAVAYLRYKVQLRSFTLLVSVVFLCDIQTQLMHSMCTVFYFIFIFCSSKEQVAFCVNADRRVEHDSLFSFDLQNLAQLQHNDVSKTIFEVIKGRKRRKRKFILVGKEISK